MEEEAALLISIESDAFSGKELTYRQTKRQAEAGVGKAVSDDYIWDLFSCHNWKKKVPRQSHTNADR